MKLTNNPNEAIRTPYPFMCQCDMCQCFFKNTGKLYKS